MEFNPMKLSVEALVCTVRCFVGFLLVLIKSGVRMMMSVEYWWYDTGIGSTALHAGRSLAQCHIVHVKSHMN